ncbi:hypothetical protein C8J57DRAFT_1214139 [Mycena rebaudengoi]|nr:hypothetical protein C8J57DRAFT_1214139 [Mycena rebaudengoi]
MGAPWNKHAADTPRKKSCHDTRHNWMQTEAKVSTRTGKTRAVKIRSKHLINLRAFLATSNLTPGPRPAEQDLPLAEWVQPDEVVVAESNTAPDAPASSNKKARMFHTSTRATCHACSCPAISACASRRPSSHSAPHVQRRTRRAGAATPLGAAIYSGASLSLLLTQILPSKRQIRLARWFWTRGAQIWGQELGVGGSSVQGGTSAWSSCIRLCDRCSPSVT